MLNNERLCGTAFLNLCTGTAAHADKAECKTVMTQHVTLITGVSKLGRVLVQQH